MGYQVGDIISVRFDQTTGGQEFLNKVFYRIVSIAAEAIIRELFDDLIERLQAVMLVVQTTTTSHTTQQVVNETNKLDFEDFGEFAIGEVVDANPLPSYAAVGYKKTVPTRLTRPGGFRLGGVSSQSLDGNLIDGAWTEAYDLMGEKFSEILELEDSGALTMVVEPVVVGRNVDGSLNLERVNIVTDMDGARVTSQVSRRAGG
jgi:hypothetical protein